MKALQCKGRARLCFHLPSWVKDHKTGPTGTTKLVELFSFLLPVDNFTVAESSSAVENMVTELIGKCRSQFESAETENSWSVVWCCLHALGPGSPHRRSGSNVEEFGRQWPIWFVGILTMGQKFWKQTKRQQFVARRRKHANQPWWIRRFSTTLFMVPSDVNCSEYSSGFDFGRSYHHVLQSSKKMCVAVLVGV